MPLYCNPRSYVRVVAFENPIQLLTVHSFVRRYPLAFTTAAVVRRMRRTGHGTTASAQHQAAAPTTQSTPHMLHPPPYLSAQSAPAVSHPAHLRLFAGPTASSRTALLLRTSYATMRQSAHASSPPATRTTTRHTGSGTRATAPCQVPQYQCSQCPAPPLLPQHQPAGAAALPPLRSQARMSFVGTPKSTAASTQLAARLTIRLTGLGMKATAHTHPAVSPTSQAVPRTHQAHQQLTAGVSASRNTRSPQRTSYAVCHHRTRVVHVTSQLGLNMN